MGKRVVVFGSFVVDLTSRSKGLPVPGQTIGGTWFRMGPGGKGSNQAVAAHRAGADVVMVTKVGRDVFGKVAADFYAAEGMDTSYIFTDEEAPTGAALIMVDETSAQNAIVVVSGACAHITPADVERARPLIEAADILLLQLEINYDALYRVIDIAYAAGVQVILNTAPAGELPDAVFQKLAMVTPNEVEAELLTGVSIKTPEDAARAAEVFLKKGVKQAVITLGYQGAYATDGSRCEHLPRLEVEAVDTTGAGDAFNGGLVTALAEGRDLFTALRYANATGALCVTRPGTAPAMPYREEILALYERHYGKYE